MTRDKLTPLYIVDASIYIFKYYFSMPSNFHANNGRPSETVYGYALWLYRFLRDENPAYIAACFDESLSSCFRNEIYPGYKQSRALPDDDLAFQLLACKRITQLMGIRCFASDTHEADDWIGSLAARAHASEQAYKILSRDKDLGQLLFDAEARLWDYPGGEPLGIEQLTQKFGVRPEQLADFLAIVGDKVDDIPGVPGVGPKSAAALLQHFGGWEQVKQNLDKVGDIGIRGARSLQNKLREYSAQVDMSVKLASIVTDLDVGEPCVYEKQLCDLDSLLSFAQELGFPRSFSNNIETFFDDKGGNA